MWHTDLAWSQTEFTGLDDIILMISMFNSFMGKSMLKSKLSSSASICGKLFVTTEKTFDSSHRYNKAFTTEVHRARQ